MRGAGGERERGAGRRGEGGGEHVLCEIGGFRKFVSREEGECKVACGL